MLRACGSIALTFCTHGGTRNKYRQHSRVCAPRLRNSMDKLVRIIECFEVRCRQRARECCTLESLDRYGACGEIPALPSLTPDSPELVLFLGRSGEVNHPLQS